MKKIITTFLLAVLPVISMASSKVHLDTADIDLHNKGSLQSGARLFVNYCMGCHSLGYMRYNRMAQDLGLSEVQVQENLMFVADFSKVKEGEPAKVGSLMTNSMPGKSAKAWFGKKVPDLSVIARSRGADWLYTYLRTFYVDEKRPFGVNNTTFPDVGMPHVLWELEGLKKPVYVEKEEHGKVTKVIEGYETVIPGKMTSVEYDNAVRDLVNFLVYVGEPAKLERQALGIWVLIFLSILFVVAYAMKKEFWKDVH